MYHVPILELTYLIITSKTKVLDNNTFHHFLIGNSKCLFFKKMFYNVFRILRMLDMQQIGRNYYNPKDPLNIPQHRYITLK